MQTFSASNFRQSVLTLVSLVPLLFFSASVSAELSANDPLPRTVETPFENLEGVITSYGSVEVEPGVRLRSFITRPEGTEGPLHPILFTQWVSCGSVELKRGSSSQLAMRCHPPTVNTFGRLRSFTPTHEVLRFLTFRFCDAPSA